MGVSFEFSVVPGQHKVLPLELEIGLLTMPVVNFPVPIENVYRNLFLEIQMARQPDDRLDFLSALCKRSSIHERFIQFTTNRSKSRACRAALRIAGTPTDSNKPRVEKSSPLNQ